jgi:uncharacterized protein
MSGLKEKIDNDIREAMKARDKDKLDALRAVKSAVLLAETEKGSSGILNEEQELKLLQKLIKQRKEAAEIYQGQNRPDLAQVEITQSAHIEAYLPKMMDEGTLRIEIQAIINELGITDPKDFGKIMGAVSRKFAGKADNKMMADIIRQILK